MKKIIASAKKAVEAAKASTERVELAEGMAFETNKYGPNRSIESLDMLAKTFLGLTSDIQDIGFDIDIAVGKLEYALAGDDRGGAYHDDMASLLDELEGLKPENASLRERALALFFEFNSLSSIKMAS